MLFLFPRYPHLKNGTEIPDCNLKNRAIWLVDTVLNRTCRTGCDPNIRFSPKWALYKPLTWQKKSQWNCDPNFRKTWETSIFTIFGTFFKIYVFGHNSRRRTFLNMRFSPEWAHYKAFTWHEKPEWFYDTNRRNIWKIVGKCKFGPVWEPHFGPPFSGWRSDDSLNLTWGIQKVLSLVIMKIQSDFGLLFSFPRYSHLKNGTKIPDFRVFGP